MSLLENIKRINQYKSASLLPNRVVEIENVSDKEVMKIFSRLLPTDVLKFGPFYIYYLIRDVDVSLWNGMLEYIQMFYEETCRGEISESYQSKFKEANLMVLCVSHDKDIYDKYEMDVLNGFLIAKYDIPRNEANIILVCFQNLYYQQEKKLKLSGGLFLHCLALNIIRQLKIKNVYLEASVKELISYYYSLGYKLGKEFCGQEDEITNLHDLYPIEKVIKKLPRDYANEDYDFSYRMKWCDFKEDDICFRTFQTFRENLSFVSQDMLKTKVKNKKEIYLGPSENPKRYKVIKTLTNEPYSKEYYGILNDGKEKSENVFHIYVWTKKKSNVQKIENNLLCIRKARKFCEEISCYVEDFLIGEEIVVVTTWRDGYESLEDYLSKRIQLEIMDEDIITKNLYQVLEKMYSLDIVPSISEKNIWISPEKLDIYIPTIICNGDVNINKEFIEELYDVIFSSNKELNRLNKQIVNTTRELVKILKRETFVVDKTHRREINELDDKIRSFGDDLNRANFHMNNMNVNVYKNSDDLIVNIENLSRLSLTNKILSMSRKQKWLKLLKMYVDKLSVPMKKYKT